MRSRDDLFPYQKDAAGAIEDRRRVALLLRPGYGKTVSTETGLLDRGDFPALVVAPARVVETDVWGAEAAAWEHLSHLDVQPLVGSPAKREALLRQNADIDVVSYENFMWLTERENIGRRYKALVWDELSKVKHPGTRRFKRARSRKGGADIETRLGLTGSPVGNHLMDLWGELMMIQPGNPPLGSTFEGFVARYFRPTKMVRTAAGLRPVAWEPLPGARDEIFQRVKQHSFALPPQSAVRVPPVRRQRIIVPMSREHTRVSEELKSELLVELANGATLEALNGSAIANKLRQLAGGSVWVSRDKWEPVHDAKLEALEELVDELQGEPLLVFNWFQPERDRILARFPAARALTDAATVAAWNRRDIPLLVAHPQSAGHGLNLQGGGAHVCWFTLPFSYELLEQGEGRLARTGQLAPVVMSHWLLCGPGDQWIADRVEAKGEEQRLLMEGVAGE
jgi:SNF2 family DNA or RNA helicase